MLYFGTTTKMGIMHNAPNYLQNAKYISKYALVIEKEIQDVVQIVEVVQEVRYINL